ncbi:DDE superfamily endonuclease [Hirsutella rhossiliensis]|uniref:DDE superfamily endonuclease domain-containing protein n=1 Tax=Hirsutella rhossiliensis TaxID=111463 RepID=A0A9P8MRY8_9HYPO|nr:DDE superfamily endonuclease domain-containing protein [Hirsutella rhossiliensis]KAH0959384.1 DDE superfamily endonuclease domain-containing protein [Hirsutella rhossiliensis]
MAPSTMTEIRDQSIPRVLLAVKAYQQGQFDSTHKATTAYDVPQSTVSGRLRETALVQWVLPMDERGMPLTRGQETVGENWVRKCEDPKTIQEWYDRVAMAKQKWGILDEDVYNFDETGFQMGVIATARPGNREWVTVIESINCQGWALPAMVIFQGKVHKASWYKAVFDPYTRRRTVGTRRLLILDGHGSHVTPEFDKYCTDNAIVVLQMPAHSSHLLQPLDVGVNHIEKEDFLPLYVEARRQALSRRTSEVDSWPQAFPIQSDPGSVTVTRSG